MKILLVITKAEIGGAQTFVLTLAQGLKQSGQDVAVAFGEGDYLPKELDKAGIKYYRLKSLKRSHNPFLIFSFIFELKKLVKKENFSVVHLNSTNTLPGAIAAKLASKKIKTVFTIHGLSILDKNYQANILIKFLFKIYFKFLLQFIDKVVFVSRYNKEEARELKIGENGAVIYNGLDLKEDYFLEPLQAREELGRLVGQDLKDDFLIGSIGRLAEQKNYHFIINFWPLIKEKKPQVKLIIIGEGPERIKYEKLIKEVGAEADIFLPGEKTSASRLLKGFDLFILPSIYEGLSISLIEAVLAGAPTLASDVGGNREIISEKNCFKVDDLENFLSKFNQDYVPNSSLEQFTAETMVKKYLKVYEV